MLDVREKNPIQKNKVTKKTLNSHRSHGYSESSPIGYCEQVLRIANQFSLANMQDMLENNYIYNSMLGATQVQGNQRLMFLNHWYCGPACTGVTGVRKGFIRH